MDRAMEAAATARLATSPRPWVGAVLVTAGGERFEGATDGQTGPHAEVVALRAAGPALAPTAPPWSARSSPARTGAGRPRAPTRSSRPASGGWSSARPTPTRRWPAPASRACGQAGVEVTVGVAGGGGRGPAGRLPPPAPHRAALRGAEAGGHARRPHRGARRLQPVDHRARGPGRRPPAAGRERRRPRRRRHRAGRRPGADGAGPAPALGRSAPQDRPAAGGARPGCRRAPASTPAWSAAARCRTCWTSSVGLRCVQLLVEGGARGRGRVPPVRASSTATCSTWRPRCSAATTRAGLFTGPGAATIGDVWRGRLVDLRRLGGGDVRVDLVPAEGASPT